MKEKKDEVILSIEEYRYLFKRNELLSHLEANGVDNWEGYSVPENEEDEEEND